MIICRITWILSNRLVLNLRQLSRTIVTKSQVLSDGAQTLSLPQFAENSIVGNLGEPLENVNDDGRTSDTENIKDCDESLEMVPMDGID